MSLSVNRKLAACLLCSLSSSAAMAVDINFFGQLQLDLTDVSAGDDLSLSAGERLRSLKLGLDGALTGQLGFQAEMKVSSDGDISLDDSYLQYAFTERTALAVGYYKVYHTLSAATSETKGGLPERSMVSDAFEIGTGGQLGAFLHHAGDNWSLEAGLSLDDLNTGSAHTDGWGLHVRATYAPILAETAFLHLGVSGYRRDEADDLVSLSASPEAWLEGDDVFSSGLVEADHYHHANVEIAGSRGPWLIQAEYGGLRTSGAQTYSYDGGYIAVSYVLTGEHRPYDAGSGTFGGLAPDRPVGQGMGAWEIGLRNSRLDLRDGVQGSFGHTWAASLNWQAARNIRLMLNATDFSSTRIVRKKGQTLGLRMQLSW
jgi:phosphate-selective porin OprO/OprP